MHAWRRGFACKGTTGGIFGTFAGLFVGGLRFFSRKLKHRRNGMVSYEKKGIVEYFSIRRKEWYFQLELE